MKINAYSSEYSSFNPKILDEVGRKKIGSQIVRLLEIHLTGKNLNDLNVLDMGCTSGIISAMIARKFKSVDAIDVDKKAIFEARKRYKLSNLNFNVKNASKTGYVPNSIDVVIANQLYYCFKNPEDLFSEIYRVLKPGGICFLGARNKYTFWDAQYHLPFLSLLPKNIANFIVRSSKRGDGFDVSYRSYRELIGLTKKFEVIRYTSTILNNPKKFGYKGLAKYQNVLSIFPVSFWIIVEPLLPNFIWILKKPEVS